MIELTQEQLQLLEQSASLPQRVVNPDTREEYVLVPVVDYERLVNEAQYDDSPWTDEERELLRAEACRMVDAFGKNP